MDASRIASEAEVATYLSNTRLALEGGAQVTVQLNRKVDQNRPERYTNKYTFADLFPDEDPACVARRELHNLQMSEYLRTVSDDRCPSHGEFWEFGRVYPEGDVYIKFRVHLLDPNAFGRHTVFLMSFHYAEKPLSEETFPYA